MLYCWNIYTPTLLLEKNVVKIFRVTYEIVQKFHFAKSPENTRSVTTLEWHIKRWKVHELIYICDELENLEQPWFVRINKSITFFLPLFSLLVSIYPKLLDWSVGFQVFFNRFFYVSFTFIVIFGFTLIGDRGKFNFVFSVYNRSVF
jgi:hypothetical protein